MKPIPFSPPDMTQEEAQAASEAVLSGWITTGPRTKQLEKVIAGFVDAEHCVCLNSQTACSEMALRLLGVGPGDEVIVPAYTYTATCSVVCHVGATPVLIDSQKDCIEMDYDKVADAITEKTVTEWENISQKDLASFFGNYIYRVKEWVNGNKANVLNEHNILQAQFF